MEEMYYTRLYTGDDGNSRFEDIKIPLAESGPIGFLSDNFEVRGMQFRINEAGYDWDFHNAPARQFIILLDGEIEITTSQGETRKFKGGDVLLVEDTGGKGHRTRNIRKQVRKSIFVKI